MVTLLFIFSRRPMTTPVRIAFTFFESVRIVIQDDADLVSDFWRVEGLPTRVGVDHDLQVPIFSGGRMVANQAFAFDLNLFRISVFRTNDAGARKLLEKGFATLRGFRNCCRGQSRDDHACREEQKKPDFYVHWFKDTGGVASQKVQERRPEKRDRRNLTRKSLLSSLPNLAKLCSAPKIIK